MSSRDGIVNLCRGPETASVRKKGIDAAVGDNGRCGVGDGNYDTHCRFWLDRAAARTSDRKRFTSSTMSFFIPSIESSSSKKKSNFYELTVTH